ncbi:PAS domain S-box protein [Methanobacterium sp.]|uniref:PAS domain S-box protein n=1 Tax=Methanobacterium sp. TaxID=2164 RepID=UPI003C7493D2
MEKCIQNDIFLKNLLKNSFIPFYIEHFNQKIVTVNKAFENLTGYTLNELNTINDLISTEFKSCKQEKTEKLLHNGESVTYELTLIRKDCTDIPIQISSHILKNEDEKLEYIYSFITDLTQQKNDESKRSLFLDKIKGERDKLSALVNNIPDEVWFVDNDKKFTLANPAALQEFGSLSDRIDIEKMAGYLEVYNSEGSIKSINETPYLMALRGEKIRNLEEIIRIPTTNKLRYRQVNASPVKDAHGKIIGAVSVVHNITKRKEHENQILKLLESEQQLAEELQSSNEELQATSEELYISNEELQQQQDYLVDINQALNESRVKFLKIFHSNPAAITLSDKNGRWIDVNKSFSNLTGYTRDELIGSTSNELNLINIKERNEYLFKSHVDGSLKDKEFEILTKSGEKRIVISSSEIIQIVNKIMFITFVYDITKRRERENLNNALNNVNSYINSRHDYNEIMQSSIEEGTLAIGAESSVINIKEDDEWVVKFVYNFPSNIIGQRKSDSESSTSVYVAGKNQAVAFNDAQNDPRVNVNGMKLHGVASLLVTPIIIKDKVQGIIAFYHHKNAVVFTDAQIDFANKLASSLSQAIVNAKLFDNIKKSEEKYHSLYSSMKEGLALHEIIYDTNKNAVDYIIYDVNPAYEQILGLNRDDVLGKKASEIYGTENPPYIDIYASVAENRKSKQFETYFEPMNKYFQISVISPEKGKFATVFEDITKRKYDEQELTRTMDELKRSNKELQQFAYAASHDLQEPLRMVSSFSQLLERRYKNRLDDDADEFIEFIVEGAQRMKNLIDDLLIYSRVTRNEKEFEEVNLEKILSIILSDFSVPIKEQHVTITHDILPTIFADASQMGQLFQNVIGNAIKFHGKADPRIHISFQEDLEGWTFAVKDNGIGIDKKYQKQIFEVFRRLHTRKEYSGTGIGLSICQKIIERHGGKLWVDSTPGRGTTFYFTIPK